MLSEIEDPRSEDRNDGEERLLSIRLFPGKDGSRLISVNAARHLYQLLLQYNHCISDPAKYKSRWPRFWKGVLQVERSVVAYFVRTHCNGEFGVRLVVEDLPRELADLVRNRQLSQPSEIIIFELQGLLDDFYKSLADPAAIDRLWLEKCSASRELLAGAKGLNEALRAYWDPSHIQRVAQKKIASKGFPAKLAKNHAIALSSSVSWFYNDVADAFYKRHEVAVLH